MLKHYQKNCDALGSMTSPVGATAVSLQNTADNTELALEEAQNPNL